MNSPDRPTFFYVFRIGDDYKIVEMTDVEALVQWQMGRKWEDVAKRTLREALELRRQLRARHNFV